MSLVATLSFLLPAHAFAPDPATGPDIEPQRVLWSHGETQGRYLASPAWRRFATSAGRGWEARFDEGTGTPRVLWGRGIPMPTSSQAALVDALTELLERYGDLLGVEPGELALHQAGYDAGSDTWYVQFDALRAGVPTYRGGIGARVKHGNLVLVHVATAPDAPVTGARVLDSYVAVRNAIADGPAPRAAHTERLAEPQLLLLQGRHGLELRQSWMVRTRTQDPPGIWVSFVDAETGELLSVHNEVRFANGNVSADHHARGPDGSPLVNSPVKSAIVTGDTDADLTDDAGDYTVANSGSYDTDFHGDYVFVNDSSGADASVSSGSPNIVWNTGTTNATQAEIDTYVFVHDVRDWAAGVAPNITVVANNPPLDANVNQSQTCNAFYNGTSINFYDPGGGCNDTGEMADVVYHEWGHGFHAFSIVAGNFDGSLSEGAADTVAFFQTGDHIIAPWFFSGGGGIRDVAPDRVYPQDYSNSPYAVHDNGLIFGGTMWDLWGLLVDDYGQAAGTDLAEGIYAGLLRGGTDIPGTYYEALLADDDDGDLSNGTPHQCQILDAFGRHGLGGGAVGGGTYTTVHEPVVLAPENVPTAIDVEVVALAADCDPVSPQTGTLHYRTDGGAWQTVSASVAAQDVTADVPQQPLGTFVEYYVDGTDTDGDRWQAPFSGEFAPYSFFVGGVIEVSCEDFEGGDGGYQHELVSGDSGDGADDWEWGAPVGVANDPSAAASGANIWGNDLGFQGFNGEYQADKVNRLWSPQIDTLWYTDVFLQYARWLNIEDATYDQAVVTANGVEVWTNHEGAPGDEHHQDRQWVTHAVDLQGIADQGAVELGWEMHSDGGLQFGGWNLDDVCVYAPLNTDNRMAITDFVVEDLGGPIGLSWTNPAYQPVERVVVTRRTDRYPEAWDDGDLIVDLTAPVPGESTQATHANVDGSAGYYAAYGFDGAEWLSWTIEGWNAGFAAANEGGTTGQGTNTGPGTDTTTPGGDEFPDDGAPGGEDKGGCGCDSGSGGASGALALGLVGLLVARRRRW
ncbi:MAG: MYXO-CTERM sorting domain-containing protein [Myxococcota bacterium]